MENQKTTERIYSPEDERDYTISMAMEVAGDVPIPSSFEVWTPPTENQKIGNCVAQAAACVMECIDHQNGQEHRDRSVGYIYFNDPIETHGMFMRDACLIMKKDGDVYRDVWERLDYDWPKYYKERKALPASITEQADQIHSFVRLRTEEECKLFMLKYNIPIFVCGECADFIGGWAKGGHAVALCGWDDNRRSDRKWRYKNSWGNNGWATDKEGKAWADWSDFREYWGFIPKMVKKFKDVPDNAWYAKAVEKATEDGIIMGYEDDTFRPNGNLTRAEFATLYERMAKKFANPTLE